MSSCIALLEGREVDDEIVFALAGPAAHQVFDGQAGQYWLHVWALRGLLYAWDDSAIAPVVRTTTDESWRVREMSLKVIAKRRIDDAIEAVADLQRDSVARVARAAERATIAVMDRSL